MKTNRAVRWLAFAVVLMSLSAASFGQVFVSVRVGPPALPIYAQPICPGPGYLWTPGYWGWNDAGGYYWVPGTWVVAPVGLLWTPGYWGWGGGFYAWHPGYWGPHVGFYGGINYGFGYGGVGFFGGEWRGGAFFYNRAVLNVGHVTNVYSRTVVVNENHVAFNGGEGGIAARATAQEEAWGREPHTEALSSQVEHERSASQNRALFASENHGRPEVAATARPGEFSGHGVVKAKAAGGEYHAPAMSPREARASDSEGARNSESRGNEMRNNDSRNHEPRNNGEAKDNNGSHSFTPPSNSHTTETRNERTHEDSHPAKAPKEPKASKHNSQPKHENAPREERNKGR